MKCRAGYLGGGSFLHFPGAGRKTPMLHSLPKSLRGLKKLRFLSGEAWRHTAQTRAKCGY
jgi:hypothetical protein